MKAATYELTHKGRKLTNDNFRGHQCILILTALQKDKATAAEITARLGKKLKTRQEPRLVTKHYLRLWKKAGLVRFARKTRRAK